MSLDPQYAGNLRTTIEYIVENEFLSAAANLQYQRIAKVIPTSSLIELLAHRIPGAVFEDYGETGGGIRYEDAVIGLQEFRNHFVKAGFSIPEGEFRDLNSKGVTLATDWAKDVAVAGAYWPQRRVLGVLKNGESSSMLTENGNVVKLVCYDGQPLFSDSHPLHIKRASLGDFTNLFHGAPSATNPGFLPLGGPFTQNSSTGEWQYDADGFVTDEQALENLFLQITFIRGMKMPDGITPRNLEPTGIVIGPRLTKKVGTITSAGFIAASSKGGGGTTEIKGLVTKLGLSEPVVFNELIGQTDLEDWSSYLVCEPQIGRSRVGAIAYGMLEPFQLHMYAATSGSEGVNLALAESNEVKWIAQGRNLVGPGMPQYVFKNKAGASAI